MLKRADIKFGILSGALREVQEDCKALCKIDGGVYFIRVHNEEPPKGAIVNPWGMIYNESKLFRGLNYYNWKIVTPDQYDIYIKFLTTKNTSFLYQLRQEN